MKGKTILTVLGVLFLGALILALSLTPRLEQVTPEQELIHAPQAIQITFSRRMNPDSVQKHLSFTPAVEGELVWDETGRQAQFTPSDPWPADTELTLQVSSGAQSRLGIPALQDQNRELSVRPFQLSYLWPVQGSSNLYQLNPQTGETRPLTQEPEGVLDYHLAPSMTEIYFSVPLPAGGSEIKNLDLLTSTISTIITCREALCRSPQVSPREDQIAYEWISFQEQIQSGIKILHLQNNQEINLNQNGEYLENPLWSAAGWLAYYNRTASRYVFWHPEDDREISFENQTGGPGSWSPDGTRFVTTEIFNLTDTLAPRHMLEYDLEDETSRDLTGAGYYEDLNPSYAPDGSGFVFARKSLVPEEWTPGRQIWIQDELDLNPHQLTDEEDYNHTSLTWHPDGDQIVYIRYNQTQPSEPPELWLIQTDGSENIRLVINGFAPTWIP